MADAAVHVIGRNTDYVFGLNHNEDLKELTNWNATHKNIFIDDIHCTSSATIFTDNNGYYWASGKNAYSQCCIFEDNAWSIQQPKQIEFFKQNNIKISKICNGISSSCTFWITDKNKVYANGCSNDHQWRIYSDDSYNDSRNQPKLIKDLENLNSYIIDIQRGYYYNMALCSLCGIDDNMIISVITNWCKTIKIEISDDVINLIRIFTNINVVYSTLYSSYGGNGHGDIDQTDNIGSGWKEIKVFHNKHIIKIRSGLRHSLFLESNGTLWCCGYNSNGQLGIGHNKTDKSMAPQIIRYFTNNNIKIKSVECGCSHNLLIDYNGEIYSFGSNRRGQCGDDTMGIEYVCTPKIIDSLKSYNIINIKCGVAHSYAKSDDDQHFLFGSNQYNECSLVDHQDNEIKIPFCINNIAHQLTNCIRIKNVYLGQENTIIIIQKDNIDSDSLDFQFNESNSDCRCAIL